MAQHTAGPWTYEPNGEDGGPEILSDFGLVCKMPTPPDDEGHANAALIAAAPSMAASLNDCAITLERIAAEAETRAGVPKHVVAEARRVADYARAILKTLDTPTA